MDSNNYIDLPLAGNGSLFLQVAGVKKEEMRAQRRYDLERVVRRRIRKHGYYCHFMKTTSRPCNCWVCVKEKYKREGMPEADRQELAEIFVCVCGKKLSWANPYCWCETDSPEDIAYFNSMDYEKEMEYYDGSPRKRLRVA